MRGGRVGFIVELSILDILKLLTGRELYLREFVIHDDKVIIRYQGAYEAFNVMAPKVE